MDEQQYEEILNSIYEPVSICGIIFDAGRALRELDPTAFYCGMSDYEDFLEKEKEEEEEEEEEDLEKEE